MGIFKKPIKESDPQWHDDDVKKLGGYVYSISKKMSTIHANKRLSDAILSAFDYKNKKVVDVGCGDGVYTYEIWEKGEPEEIIGADPARVAVESANKNFGKKNMKFFDYSIYNMPWPDNHFDIAVVRGVIHHLDKPAAGVKEAVRIAKNIVLTDPNGYNLGLKVIEKVSPYHRQHKEMSFFPHQYNRWLRLAGAQIIKDYYILIVPFFTPNFIAKFLMKLEPIVEKTPLLRSLICSTHVRVAKKTD